MGVRTRHDTRTVVLVTLMGGALLFWRFYYYPRQALRLGMPLSEVATVGWPISKVYSYDMVRPRDKALQQKIPVYGVFIWHMGVTVFLNSSKDVIGIDYLFGKGQRVKGYSTWVPAQVRTDSDTPLSIDKPQR